MQTAPGVPEIAREFHEIVPSANAVTCPGTVWARLCQALPVQVRERFSPQSPEFLAWEAVTKPRELPAFQTRARGWRAFDPQGQYFLDVHVCDDEAVGASGAELSLAGHCLVVDRCERVIRAVFSFPFPEHPGVLVAFSGPTAQCFGWAVALAQRLVSQAVTEACSFVGSLFRHVIRRPTGVSSASASGTFALVDGVCELLTRMPRRDDGALADRGASVQEWSEFGIKHYSPWLVSHMSQHPLASAAVTEWVLTASVAPSRKDVTERLIPHEDVVVLSLHPDVGQVVQESRRHFRLDGKTDPQRKLPIYVHVPEGLGDDHASTDRVLSPWYFSYRGTNIVEDFCRARDGTYALEHVDAGTERILYKHGSWNSRGVLVPQEEAYSVAAPPTGVAASPAVDVPVAEMEESMMEELHASPSPEHEYLTNVQTPLNERFQRAVSTGIVHHELVDHTSDEDAAQSLISLSGRKHPKTRLQFDDDDGTDDNSESTVGKSLAPFPIDNVQGIRPRSSSSSSEILLRNSEEVALFEVLFKVMNYPALGPSSLCLSNIRDKEWREKARNATRAGRKSENVTSEFDVSDYGAVFDVGTIRTRVIREALDLTDSQESVGSIRDAVKRDFSKKQSESRLLALWRKSSYEHDDEYCLKRVVERMWLANQMQSRSSRGGDKNVARAYEGHWTELLIRTKTTTPAGKRARPVASAASARSLPGRFKTSVVVTNTNISDLASLSPVSASVAQRMPVVSAVMSIDGLPYFEDSLAKRTRSASRGSNASRPMSGIPLFDSRCGPSVTPWAPLQGDLPILPGQSGGIDGLLD